jgi:hypothetical protein
MSLDVSVAGLPPTVVPTVNLLKMQMDVIEGTKSAMSQIDDLLAEPTR